MITISTNSDNDLYIDASGNLAISEDIYALSNVIKNKALTTYGEPQYNQQSGIPYFETIFTDTPSIDLYQAKLIDDIENTEHTQRVRSFDYTESNGVLNYTVTIQSDFGEIILNG